MKLIKFIKYNIYKIYEIKYTYIYIYIYIDLTYKIYVQEFINCEHINLKTLNQLSIGPRAYVLSFNMMVIVPLNMNILNKCMSMILLHQKFLLVLCFC